MKRFPESSSLESSTQKVSDNMKKKIAVVLLALAVAGCSSDRERSEVVVEDIERVDACIEALDLMTEVVMSSALVHEQQAVLMDVLADYFSGLATENDIIVAANETIELTNDMSVVVTNNNPDLLVAADTCRNG